jgi:hypothetical protein
MLAVLAVLQLLSAGSFASTSSCAEVPTGVAFHCQGFLYLIAGASCCCDVARGQNGTPSPLALEPDISELVTLEPDSKAAINSQGPHPPVTATS